MAFFDKLGDLAKNLGDKTSDAIETGKLNSRINAEKAAAGEELKKIGEHYYNLFLADGQAAPEVLAFCEAAKAHNDAAAEAQAEIDRIRAENEAEKAAAAVPASTAPDTGVVVCAACGTSNPQGTKFCCQCGGKLEAPAASDSQLCPACGAANVPGTKFCCECGEKLAPPAEQAKPVCPSCGAQVAAGVKFCNECGTRIE